MSKTKNLNTGLEIGGINRPHGLKGEVIASIISNLPDRLTAGSRLQVQNQQLILKYAKPYGGPGPGSAAYKSTSKKFILAFEGIETREDAQQLRGKKLVALTLPETGGQDLWVHQLIGCQVQDQNGKNHGTISGIEANPASDLLILSSGALIPAVFISSFEEGVVVVDVPDGLLDIQNTGQSSADSSDSSA